MLQINIPFNMARACLSIQEKSLLNDTNSFYMVFLLLH